MPQAYFAQNKVLTRLCIFAFFGISALALYAICWDLRPFPIYAPVDDWKYAKDALSIASGHWLGPYGTATLTKRPLFPVVLALTHLLGIPFTVFLYSFHFTAAVAISAVWRKWGYSRWFCATLFITYLFMPMCFDHQANRVIRDFYFVSLQTSLLATALYFLSIPRELATRKKRLWTFFGFLVLFSLHYGTREEYMVFWPTLGILFIFHVLKVHAQNLRDRIRYGVLVLAFAATSITTTGFLIRTLNYINYGSFVLIEHEEGSFPIMIGHLASITEGTKNSKLWLNWEGRERLSQLLPRWRPFQKPLSNPAYDPSPRCQLEGKCEPYDFSHQIFTYRDSLANGGSPLNGRGAELFYQGIVADIERLCGEHQLSCESPLRTGMLPRFHLDELQDLIHFLGVNTTDMILFRHRGMVREFNDDNSPEIFEKFNELTRQPHFRITPNDEIIGPAPAVAAVIRAQERRREALGVVYNWLGPSLGVLALLALVVRIFLFFRIPNPTKWRDWNIGFVVSIALFSSIVGRILLISYISAVDNYMGGNYITPNYHLFLLLCLLLIAEGVATFRKGATPKAPKIRV